MAQLLWPLILPLLVSAVMTVTGIRLLTKGFRKVRRYRLISELPPSTIRSLAMGLVELKGVAKSDTCLHSPLTHTPCVYYRYVLMEYKILKSLANSRNKSLLSTDTQWVPFTLQDESGSLPISPQKSSWMIEKGTAYAIESSSREKVMTALREGTLHTFPFKKLDDDSPPLTNELRMTEWIIPQNEEIYVLGSATLDEKDKPFITKGSYDFVISDKKELDLMKTIIASARRTFYTGVRLASFGIALLIGIGLFFLN